jgi:hypothetical protein
MITAAIALFARFRKCRLIIAGAVAASAFRPILRACALAGKARLGRSLELPAPTTPAANALMFAVPFTSTAFQGSQPCPFARKARPIVIDRANSVLAHHRRSVLVTLGFGTVTLAEEEIE